MRTIDPGLRKWLWFSVGAMTFLPADARASFLKGEALDKAADVMSWIVLILVPVVGIAVFWLLHIMPEKIAEMHAPFEAWRRNGGEGPIPDTAWGPVWFTLATDMWLEHAFGLKG